MKWVDPHALEQPVPRGGGHHAFVRLHPRLHHHLLGSLHHHLHLQMNRRHRWIFLGIVLFVKRQSRGMK
ncbi:hypothetical protein A2U01_0074516 [Trifolium medium]|uniref:Uncharacterized protein n=1 Tax=Trifolium medium TaxID=97028 RepID=A0A392SZH4_9FABA|nr:hypothetical protein [Trifolium medium]